MKQMITVDYIEYDILVIYNYFGYYGSDICIMVLFTTALLDGGTSFLLIFIVLLYLIFP